MGHLDNGMREQIIRQFSDEFNLIVQCSQVIGGEDNKTNINSLLSKEINWENVLYLADGHKVIPTFYRKLSGFSDQNLPNWVLEELRNKARRIAMNALFMASELLAIVGEMEKSNIQSIVLKGYPMAAKLYGDFTIRPSQDIDIFVKPEDMELAKRIVETRGFQFVNHTFDPTPARLSNWLHTQHHFSYWHKEKRINVELHWRIGHSGLEIPFEIITDNLSAVTLSGHVVTSLCNEVQLIHLAMHGASHKWSQLKWVQDIALIIERGNISWTAVFDLAERIGVSSLVCQAIILAYWISGVKVDEDIQRRINEDRRGQKLAQMALHFLLNKNCKPLAESVWSSEYYRRRQYQFALQSGWRRKMQLLGNCVRPVDEDMKIISLPDWLYSLYFVIRPLSWVKRRLGQVLKG